MAALRSQQERVRDQAAARDALVMQRHQDAKAREDAAREAAARQRKIDMARYVQVRHRPQVLTNSFTQGAGSASSVTAAAGSRAPGGGSPCRQCRACRCRARGSCPRGRGATRSTGRQGNRPRAPAGAGAANAGQPSPPGPAAGVGSG